MKSIKDLKILGVFQSFVVMILIAHLWPVEASSAWFWELSFYQMWRVSPACPAYFTPLDRSQPSAKKYAYM